MQTYHNFHSLVIVPGHGVYVGENREDALNHKYWHGLINIAGYCEASLYREHLKAGIIEAARNPDSLLFFSGGRTQNEVKSVSEAQGLFQLAIQHDWFGNIEIRSRSILEEYARDSYENLFNSIALFTQITGSPPALTVVCGFGFKKERFEMHWKHIQSIFSEWHGILDYHSVNNPASKILPISIKGENKTRELFKLVPDGSKGELLQKRLSRDPNSQGNPWEEELFL